MRGAVRFAMCGLASVVLLLAGCGNDEPIRVGFVAKLSGRDADLGSGGRNGAMLAVEQRNAAGGIDGRRVDLLVRDAGQRVDTARQAMTELIDQKVDVVIGPMTSNIAMPLVPLADAAKIPLISPTATATDLTGRDDYFFRVISDTRDYAALNARFQFEKLSHRKAAALYDGTNRAYTESWLRDFQAEFEKLGGEFTRIQSFHSGGDVAFFDLARQLLETTPDLVLIVANAVDAAQICQQLRKIDPSIPIAMSEWASTERFIEMAGNAAENIHVAQFLDRNDRSPRYLMFRAAYLRRFGQEPGFPGVAGYDATRVALDALTRRSPGRSLKEILLETREVAGAQQMLSFDRFGDAQRKTFLAVIRDGRYRTLE